jgi:endonuclease G
MAAAVISVLAVGNPLLAANPRYYHYAGVPKRVSYPNVLITLTNTGYAVGYDEMRKNPAWVAYRLFKVDKAPKYPRPKKFIADRRTRSKVRHEDYSGTGFDRGHMAPNYAIATRYGPKAQTETFYMSNIVPQKFRLNRQTWRLLEDLEANRYANKYGEIWIITGPIYSPADQLLPKGIEIPRSFYRIILDELDGQPRVIAWEIPQDVEGNEPLDRFLVSVDRIESDTGLDFFSELEDEVENRMERTVNKRMWGEGE